MSQKKNKKKTGYQDEIIILISLVLSLLMILSSFHLSGAVGETINGIIAGCFGFLSYFFPYIFFFGIAFYISNRGNRSAIGKLYSCIGLYILAMAFVQMIMNGQKIRPIISYYASASLEKTGGGLLGGFICNILVPLFGISGSYVVLFALALICIMFCTEKLFFAGLHRKMKQTKQNLPVAIQKKTKQEASPTRKKLQTVTISEGKEEEQQASKTDLIEPIRRKKKKQVQEDMIETAALERQLKQEMEQMMPLQKMGSKEAEKIPISLLAKPKRQSGTSKETAFALANRLQETLHSFGVRVTVQNIQCGPSVTRYELQPEQGVKVSRITNLADDIKLNLAAADIRIEAPIPGKAAVGIEVPNTMQSIVTLRELLEDKTFLKASSPLTFAVGKDIAGEVVVADIAKMPHLLIAGATGSGKSVCMNTLIISLLYKASPKEVKFIMIDPKVVELNVYNGIPHLLIPVVTDPKKAAAALHWAVAEMTKRYQAFANLGVRDLKGYLAKRTEEMEYFPQIVILVDELSDLMMVAPGEVEDAICRLAQMARAAGLHLILATQRPSVNVITGLIKANVPSRIAFAVSSSIDSRTILDGSGAEKLLGKGDMLFFPSGYPKPVRVQGAFVSDQEVSDVVEFLAKQYQKPQYDTAIEQDIASVQTQVVQTGKIENQEKSQKDGKDALFTEAACWLIEKEKASIGMLQRMYRIGFNRAARLMDQLYEAGVVGPEDGTRPRKITMSLEDFQAKYSFLDQTGEIKKQEELHEI